jgi:hypothetical protein
MTAENPETTTWERQTDGMGSRRIEELAASSPELAGVLRELRGSGLREPVGPDPLLSPTLPAGSLDEFLSLAVRECSEANLFGLALALPMCAFQRGAGYEALEYCLTRRGLPPERREFVAGRMLGAKSVADVVWAHGIVLSTQNTGLYHSFLSRHAKVVTDKCFDQAAKFLLDPARGPGGYAAGCVELVLRQDVRAWRPFVRRWLEWLDAGLFDGLFPRTGERPVVMYRILDENAGRQTFELLRDAAHRRVVRLIDSGRLPAVWQHLAGMVEAEYSAADPVGSLVQSAVDVLDAQSRATLAPAVTALRALAAAQRTPDDDTRRWAHEARLAMIQSRPPI